jgi:hypothetical protein
MAALDYYDDVNQQQFYMLDRLYGIPEFVKQAEFETGQDVRDLPATAFAEPVHRKFPCHTKAATWLAQAYFSANQGLYSKEQAGVIQDRIEKSAQYWGIQNLTHSFKKGWAKLASREMPEVSDGDHALVVDYGTHKLRRMPMPNAISVKLAADFLYANRAKYPLQWRKSAARRILRKMSFYDGQAAKGVKVAGAELGITKLSYEVRNYLERAAGLGAAMPEKVAEKIAQRVFMLPERRDDLRLKLAEVAQDIAKVDSLSNDELDKVAELLDEVDRSTGLAAYYHTSVDMPEEICYDVLEKEAAAILDGHVVLTTGNVYPLELFRNLPIDKMAAVMGDEFADAVRNEAGDLDLEKFAEVAPTLPRPDALLLERIVSSSEGEPTRMEKVARAAKSCDLSFDKDEMRKFLADQGRKVSEPDYTLTAKR